MKMMVMKVVLLLLLVLSCVSADVLHEGIATVGCSESDGEAMVGMDGEKAWYADFEKHVAVYGLPPFADPFTYEGVTYPIAEKNLRVCKSVLEVLLGLYKNVSRILEQPSSVMVYSRDEVILGQENTLICFVGHFYPAPVNISWTRNGENVTEGSSINTPYPNSDETYTQISRLDFTPRHGDKYNCTVKHVSLNTPVTRSWEVEVEQPSVGPAVFCGFGLIVGLLGVAVGTFFLIKGNKCN